MSLKIAIYDGERYKLNTGYGALSRGIIRALKGQGCEIFLQKTNVEFAKDIPSRKELEMLPVIQSSQQLNSMDLVLQVGTPLSAVKFDVPTIIYTQNALGDLIDEWVQSLQKVDGIIVPGEFDARVFRKYFDTVYTCPQYVDTNLFNLRTSYRQEGSSNFTFMFVGGYGYRKGTDLLVEAFCKAFNPDENVEMVLYCATGFETAFNHIISIMQKYNPLAKIKLFASSYTPSWMSRYYNRADAFITLSRGEGWCMPFYEALLCGKPAIAPASTAMFEAIPSEFVRFVSVQEIEIQSINDDFGRGMKSFYGKPGNTCYEPSLEEAIIAMREVKEKYSSYQTKALEARAYIVHNYSLEKIGNTLLDIVTNFLNQTSKKMVVSSQKLAHLYDQEYYLKQAAGGHLIKNKFDFKKYTNCFRSHALSLSQGRVVCDIGGGRGEVSKYYLSLGNQVIYVDYSQVALTIAKNFIGESKNIQYLNIDASELLNHVESESIDVVFMNDFLEHINWSEFLIVAKIVYQVLKPTGILIVHTPEKYYGSVITQKAVEPKHINLMDIQDLYYVLSQDFTYVDTFTWDGFAKHYNRGQCIELFAIAVKKGGLTSYTVELNENCEIFIHSKLGWQQVELEVQNPIPPKFLIEGSLTVTGQAGDSIAQFGFEDKNQKKAFFRQFSLKNIKIDTFNFLQPSEMVHFLDSSFQLSSITKLIFRIKNIGAVESSVKIKELYIRVLEKES